MYCRVVTKILDESTGNYYYYNSRTGFTSWSKPLVLGNYDCEDFVDDEEVEFDEDEDDNDVDSKADDDESGAPKKRTEKRKRKYPRSKCQAAVDKCEDDELCVDLNLSGMKATRFSTRVFELETIESLDISHNYLSRLSPDVEFLGNLRQLSLSHNFLTQLPNELKELKRLTRLDVSFNKLTTIPIHLFKLSNLQFLDLAGNNIVELPLIVGDLELLKETKVWEVGVGMLKKLEEINLSHNCFKMWPSQLESCIQLKKISFSHNHLRRIASTIKLNRKLVYLDVSYNLLGIDDDGKLRGDIETLAALEYLDLSHNDITDLFSDASKLEHLLYFNVKHNKLYSLPNSFGAMYRLVEVDISHNNIDSLPASIGNCASIKTFKAQFNRLGPSLVDSIGGLKSLQEIYLHNNLLTSLPDSIAACRNVKRVTLNQNQLQQLPDDIGQWQDLNALNLSSNCLQQLPPSLFTITKVKFMDFHANRIIEIPSTLGLACSLAYLDFRGNLLKSLPDSAGDLRFLEFLDISHNEVQSLPSMTRIRNIKVLHLDHNSMQPRPDAFDSLIGYSRPRPSSSTLPPLQHLNSSFNNIEAIQHDDMTPLKIKLILQRMSEPVNTDEQKNLLSLMRHEIDSLQCSDPNVLASCIDLHIAFASTFTEGPLDQFNKQFMDDLFDQNASDLVHADDEDDDWTVRPSLMLNSSRKISTKDMVMAKPPSWSASLKNRKKQTFKRCELLKKEIVKTAHRQHAISALSQSSTADDTPIIISQNDIPAINYLDESRVEIKELISSLEYCEEIISFDINRTSEDYNVRSSHRLSQIIYWLGVCNLTLQDTKALIYFQRAHALNPNWKNPLLMSAKLLVTKGNYLAASQNLRIILSRIDKYDSDTFLFLSRIMAKERFLLSSSLISNPSDLRAFQYDARGFPKRQIVEGLDNASKTMKSKPSINPIALYNGNEIDMQISDVKAIIANARKTIREKRSMG